MKTGFHSRSMQGRGAAQALIIRTGDPKEYGYICPHCQRRYGARQHLGVVDVVRCTQCPSMADAGQHYLEKRREWRRDRYERTKV